MPIKRRLWWWVLDDGWKDRGVAFVHSEPYTTHDGLGNPVTACKKILMCHGCAQDVHIAIRENESVKYCPTCFLIQE